jgi:uncharacterized damage-inducible protein DinB
MHRYFTDLFAYTTWATRRVLAALEQAPQEEALRLMSHVVAAQDIWLARLDDGYHWTWGLWETHPLDEILRASDQSLAAWQQFLETRAPEDFERTVTYADLRGQAWSQPLHQIITHVLNHGTHHRAQVATLLRQAEHTPPPLDYIIYLRDTHPNPPQPAPPQ